MLSSFRISALTLTLTTGLIAAGCGSSASLSPTGPSIGTSSSVAVTSQVVAGASEASTEAGKGGNAGVDAERGRQADKEKDKERDKDRGKGVDVNGRITSIAAATRTLVIGTRQVSVPVTATIRHGSTTLAFADLAVGDRVQVKGTLNATAVLVASEVKVEQGGTDDGEDDDETDDDESEDDADEAELSGTASATSGTCPALTFTIQTTKVATTATTKFRAITCAAIVNGTVVEVKGTRQADGSIVATRVSLED